MTTAPPIRVRDVFLTVLVVASLLLIGLGLQQRHYQAQADAQRRQFAAEVTARDACVNQWGTDLVHSVRHRSKAGQAALDATARLNYARAVRDDAVGNVLLVIVGLREHPPVGAASDFDKALARFAASAGRLTTVQAQVTKAGRHVHHIRARNPIPSLHCGA